MEWRSGGRNNYQDKIKLIAKITAFHFMFNNEWFGQWVTCVRLIEMASYLDKNAELDAYEPNRIISTRIECPEGSGSQ